MTTLTPPLSAQTAQPRTQPPFITLVEDLTSQFVDTLHVSLPVFQIASTILALLISVYIIRKSLSVNATLPKRYTVPLPRLPETQEFYAEPGVRVKGSSAVQCYAPATGQLLGYINPSTPESIDKCIDAAETAQKAWSKTSFNGRKAVLASMKQYILKNAEEICRVASLDSGKPKLDAELGEIYVTVEKLSWTIKHGEKALRPSSRPTSLLMSHKKNTVYYEPRGVVAALVSWNYPFHNLLSPVISAIFAGNAIVVKVSEQTAWSSNYFATIARGALVAHGHDPRLVQTVVCWPETADHLTSHPKISHITFIGSQAVGQKVATVAAKSVTPVLAELGGKDPCIVLDSASWGLTGIAHVILRGTFQASGQNCIGVERVIAAGNYDKLIEILEPRVKALKIGLKGDLGAMISPASFDRLEGLVQEAVSKGARLLAGGHRYNHPDYPKGHYFEPTLLVDVTPDMAIASNECFGPILTLFRAKSSSPEDILALANAPNFDLGASVHGSKYDPDLNTVVRGLKAGSVAVNDFATFYAVQLPFGGARGSGYGRLAGEEGLRGLCNIKGVCDDRLSWIGVRIGVPLSIRYPIASQEKTWKFMHGVVELGYSDVPMKVKALWTMLVNM